jgi:hypothetical protein
MEILVSTLYILLFILLISKLRFFESEGLSRKTISLLFLFKILAAFILWFIYTHYYKDRGTADIFKYFDDSKVMFDALASHPIDYLKMLSGIGNNTPHFDVYYNQMHNWVRLYDSNLYNDSHTIIRFNAFIRLFSFGFYQVHAVFLCFLSLCGLLAIYHSFTTLLPGKRKLLMICVFLFPSVVFWGSGVLKEGILFFGLGMLVYFWYRFWFQEFNLFYLAAVAFCIVLLLATKFYILVSLLPGLLFIAWVAKTGTERVFLKFLITLGLYTGLGLGVKYGLPAYDPLQVLAIKQQDFISLARGGLFLRNDTSLVFLSEEQRAMAVEQTDQPGIVRIRPGTAFCYWHDYDADPDTLFGKQADNQVLFRVDKDIPRSGSLIHLRPLKASLGSFLLGLPAAWFNSLFRPLPNETGSALLLPALIEIICYSGFFVLCIVFRKKRPGHTAHILFCLSFAAILFAITGLTTPVVGALVRYKIPGLPFLLISFLFLLDEKALALRFPRLGKILGDS